MGLIATVGKDNGPLRLFTGDEVFQQLLPFITTDQPKFLINGVCGNTVGVLPQYVQGLWSKTGPDA